VASDRQEIEFRLDAKASELKKLMILLRESRSENSALMDKCDQTEHDNQILEQSYYTYKNKLTVANGDIENLNKRIAIVM
jgi:hypothetical protein